MLSVTFKPLMLSAIVQGVVMLSVMVPNAVIASVVLLNVMASILLSDF
jgi:hypothetical protein